MILKINPTPHIPIDPQKLSHLIVRALESLVQYPAGNRIPRRGLLFRWLNVSIVVTSHLPGEQDLTYQGTAALLRGIYEVSLVSMSASLDMEVYAGVQDDKHHQGHATLFVITPGETS